jgi:hypothetical protein
MQMSIVEGFGGRPGLAGFAGSFGFRDEAFGGGAGFGGSSADARGTFCGFSGDLAGH